MSSAGERLASTEELEALCLVMRAHELSAPEVEQFRSIVFAACANRQYPELFEDDDFAHSPQVAQTAAEMINAGTGLNVGAGDRVPATARTEELRAALQEQAGPRQSKA